MWSFAYRSWEPTVALGSPEEIASHFRIVTDDLCSAAKVKRRRDLVFEIIDVRPGAYTDAQIEDLLTILRAILDPEQRSSLGANSVLLFAGSARSLSEHEGESDQQRSIKRDAEFAIRTLQSHGLAHYVNVGDDGVSSSHVQSALIGFLRFYQSVERRDSREAVTGLRSFVKRMMASIDRLEDLRYVGIPEGADKRSCRDLLLEIELLYQFGKGERPEQFRTAKRLDELLALSKLTYLAKAPHSSYQLLADAQVDISRWAIGYHAAVAKRDANAASSSEATARDSAAAEALAEKIFKIRRYELLRDFGRLLGGGALAELSKYDAPKLLIVDDDLHEFLSLDMCDRKKDSRRLFVQRLSAAFETAWRSVASIHVARSELINGQNDGLTDAHITRLFDAKEVLLALDAEGCSVQQALRPEEYLTILIDPESKRDGRGPTRVQRLANCLSHVASSMRSSGATNVWTPPIVAFSHKESSGYVQQCLNMGAAAFVPKDRPFHLLFDLARVLRVNSKVTHRTDHASQFRILNGLKPHVAAKLKLLEAPSAIYGGYELASGRVCPDAHEFGWVRSLPKADLHYHIGTAIHPEAVGLLALNTVGHFITTGHNASRNARGAASLTERVARTVVLSARLCEHAAQDTFRPQAMITLAAAAWGVRPDQELSCKQFGLGDAIVDHLRSHIDHCDEPHAAAMLVAMIVLHSKDMPSVDRRRYFSALKSVAGSSDDGRSFSAAAALAIELDRARDLFVRAACRWDGKYTENAYNALVDAPPEDFWEVLQSHVDQRVSCAEQHVTAALRDAERWLDARSGGAAVARAADWLRRNGAASEQGDRRADQESVPSLRMYAQTATSAANCGLQLYLRGADLLGSAHLQYPENLWMAAHSIALDNASDNVLYSEIRCETTGYTKAGMGAFDATELLRHGFNLANLFVATQNIGGRRLPLTRTNILLAAKRHKGAEEARKVVALLGAYLDRRPGVADQAYSRRVYRSRFAGSMPGWWRPCDVVGFDISGDESCEAKWLDEVLKPLAAHSSPITIHAGEAESAKSIWQAVHTLSALRIGHGLRLGEDIALLGYCVREGICMEFCPNSNVHTNGYRSVPEGEPSETRYDYPLLQYMREGMEVSIGTDNRYLHPDTDCALTSEYITAARLVGGLTRWEILQIVKAGFKNAFLDKSEVRNIVNAAEEEIYRLI